MKSRAFQYALFPLVLAGSIATVVVLVELGLSVPKACFLTVFLSAAVIAGLERLWPRLDGFDLLADPQSPRDLAHTILVSRVGGPLGALAVVTVIGLLSSDDGTALVSWWPEALPFTVEVLAAWLVFGFFEYWMHRGYHSINALWWVHSMHHDIEGLHVLKAGRVHLLEGAVAAALVSLPLVIIGVPGDVLVAALTLTAFLNNLCHANLAQRFWQPVHWLVPTVELHHIHHAVDRSLHDTNLGIPIWDKAFGTYTSPTTVWRPEIGIASRGPTTLRGQLVFPLRQWFGARTTAS